ncbi:MAG TPA: nucleotidyltransferase family protein [Acidobacteriaceae bacterium]
MSIAAIILAAGESTRLGRPKQTLQINQESLLERAVRLASEAGFSPVIAVLRDNDLIDAVQKQGAIALLNRKSYEGMASSIRCGVEAARSFKASGVVVMTCDQPGVTADHLRALTADDAAITGSAYAGRVGVPAYFPAASFDALLALQGNTGARELLRGARSISNEALNLDIDTEQDFRKAQALFER